MASNPANAAMPYLQQVPDTITPYYQPYIDAGTQSLGTLQDQYNTLLTNPQAIMQMLGGSYQQSPGYQYDYNQSQNAAMNAAAAGGYVGTPANQNEAANAAYGVSNQDYWNYVNHMTGLYNTGLEGEQGLNQMGYGASNSLAQALGQNLNTEAGLAYAGQANQNKMNQASMNALAQALGAAGSAAMMFI
jgi:hypothetical protein